MANKAKYNLGCNSSIMAPAKNLQQLLQMRAFCGVGSSFCSGGGDLYLSFRIANFANAGNNFFADGGKFLCYLLY